MTDLADYGWTTEHEKQWNSIRTENLAPARVVADFGTSLKIATPAIMTAELSGKLAHYQDRQHTPKVGDWVSVAISDNRNATIESVVLRKNEISRKVAGRRTIKQVIAANVDIAFVLLGLDNDFSVERLKRFLYQLSINSIEPVIILNKADKTDDLKSFTQQLSLIDVPIIITTATNGSGVADIAARIQPAKTAILLGSSGVGKSTITNALLERDTQATNSVRESDSTGRHTTVHRELFILPNQGILIDTPGIRELQLWGTEDELDENYDDIAELATHCKYKNCRHTSESGCAINSALKSGALDKLHYANYVKMKQELINLAAKATDKIRQSRRRSARSNKDTVIDSFDQD